MQSLRLDNYLNRTYVQTSLRESRNTYEKGSLTGNIGIDRLMVTKPLHPISDERGSNDKWC